jgi:hypothetical protein
MAVDLVQHWAGPDQLVCFLLYMYTHLSGHLQTLEAMFKSLKLIQSGLNPRLQ